LANHDFTRDPTLSGFFQNAARIGGHSKGFISLCRVQDEHDINDSDTDQVK